MDSISVDDEKINNNKKYLVVKIPANVLNNEKCIELLGGKEKINNKFIKNEDIELSLFLKKIPLEKCWSNDVLIRRKRMRNKYKPGEFKYKYDLVGKIDSMYDFFALHDFISINPEKKNFELDVIEKFIIDPKEENSLIQSKDENIIKDDWESENNNPKDDKNKIFTNNEDNEQNEGLKKEKSRNETILNIKNIIKNRIETNSLKANNIFQFLQPDKFSYGRNMYPHIFKELETSIKYKAKNEY